MRYGCVFVLAVYAMPHPAFAQIRFEEIARKAGLDFRLKNAASGRFHQVELMPGGVAAFDFDNDGCMDLFFTNGATIPELKKTGPAFSNRLYRNNCDGTFTDVTARAGVGGEGYSMAVATADFDNDGLCDIFVAGVNRNILYRNLGDGRFADVTAKAGLSGIDPKRGKMWSISAGWFDYDNDGWLDLFVSNYVAWDAATEPACGSPRNRFYCHPKEYRGPAEPTVPQQSRRHFHRRLGAFGNRRAHRQGDGSGLRRFRWGWIHRHIRGQRFRAGIFYSAIRAMGPFGKSVWKRAWRCAKTEQPSRAWAWTSATSTTTACQTW